MQIDNQIASRDWRSRGANSNHIPGGTGCFPVTCIILGARRVGYNPDFRERQAASAKAKAALLEKFRATAEPDNPERKMRDEARLKMVEARKARTAERETARIARQKALAEEAAREAERRSAEGRAATEAAERAARLKAEEETRIAAEQKAARDARYAARKAAKRQRRQQQKERPPLR
jgi:Family of unknown function (DUF6481)